MFRIYVASFIIILSLFEISTLPIVKQSEVEKSEDYPSDTHTGAGAVKAFSQLVSDSDDSGSSRANRDHDDDAEVGGGGKDSERVIDIDEGGKADLKLDEFDDSDDSDAQYLIEEFYSYTYDEATDADIVNDSNTDKNSSGS